MHCRHYEKQTKGKTSDVKLDGLTCREAEHCRRKGICVLSPFSKPDLAQDGTESKKAPQVVTRDGFETYFEILRFKNALGFQWQRIDSFTEAVKAANKHHERGQPKVIRRVELFQLPD